METEPTNEQAQATDGGQVPQEAFVPLDNSGGAPVAAAAGYRDEGWSWGAAMLNMYFIIAVRQYMYLLLFILFMVPFVNLITIPVVLIFLGFKGRELARGSSTFSTQDEYIGFMKGADHAGKIMFYFMIGMFVIGIVASISLASLGSARYRAYDAQTQYQMDMMEEGLEDMEYQMEMMR